MPEAGEGRVGFVLPPQHAATWQRAIALLKAGETEQAAELLVGLHRSVPDSVPVALQASQALLRLDAYRQARQFAIDAANAPFDSMTLLLQVVALLKRFEEPAAIEALVAGSGWRRSGSARQLSELALHLGTGGSYGLAAEILDHVARTDPGYAHAYYLRGAIEMFSGRAAEARQALEAALALSPDQPHARLLLSMHGDTGVAEHEIDAIRKGLLAGGLPAEQEAYLAYALHNWLHALGRTDEAWQALQRACAAKRLVTPYRRSEQRTLFAALKAMRLQPVDAAPRAGEGPGLIFIVGMHRSGTTLIERVLAGHPDVADGGESYVLPAGLREATDHDGKGILDLGIVQRAQAADFALLRQRTQAYARWRAQGKAWLTEKLPSNFLNVGFILHALPDAKILHVKRDPVETCFSNLRTFFTGSAAGYSYDQEDLADYYIQYRDLMAHWRASAPGRILDVDYSAFVADPDLEARRMLDHCGLSYVASALDVSRPGGVAATASAMHVRQGILKDRGEAWKPYATYLAPLIRGLASADS